MVCSYTATSDTLQYIFSVCLYFFSSRLFHWRLNLFVMLIVLIFIIPFYSSYKIVSSIRLGESIFPLFFFLHSSCIFSRFSLLILYFFPPSFPVFLLLLFFLCILPFISHLSAASSCGTYTVCRHLAGLHVHILETGQSFPHPLCQTRCKHTHTQYDIV